MVNPWQQQLETLGDYIRTQRKLANLTLRDLAALTDVSNAYLSQIERGLHEPSVRILRSIAQALEISSNHLLTQAGLLEDDPSTRGTEAAILADSTLSPGQKDGLLAVYRSYVLQRERAEDPSA